MRRDFAGWYIISAPIVKYYAGRHWCWQHISKDDWQYNSELKEFHFKNSDDAIMFKLKYAI